ncbi:MAG: hypothetical protein AAGJ94_08075 [Pseudomonadota bacterium]
MRRLFVLDPVCAQPYGHNINALHYFSEFFEATGYDVQALSSRLLPEELTLGKISREFSFLYDDAINVTSLMSRSERDFMRTAADPGSKLALATGEMHAFLSAFDVTRDDKVFFPSVDFYGLMGFLLANNAREEARRPQLYLRFIGVMERTAPGFPEPRNRLFSELRRALGSDENRINLSAETPELAGIMTQDLGVPVATTPYPLLDEARPMSMDGPLVILAAGASRFDKGYTRLKPIYDHLTQIAELGSFEFIIQSPPEDVLAASLQYSGELFSLPHVHIMPSTLTKDVLDACYERAHVVVMPYDRAVYSDRGSAVMQEAAAYGRFVVGQLGTGFAPQISTYGIGLVANTEIDFATQLGRIIALPREQLANLALEGRANYVADARQAYESWLQ